MMPRDHTDRTHLSARAGQPQDLWVGVGCQRGTPDRVIAAAIQQIFRTHRLAETAIAGIATLDRKADEAGLVAFCRDRSLPLRCFSAEVLRSVPVPHPSQRVQTETETPSVAEAAALAAATTATPEKAPPDQGMDPAIATLTVPKQIFRLEGHPGAVAIAVAQAWHSGIGRETNQRDANR